MKAIFQTNMTQPSDVELVDLCLRGHREAYGQIVERYQNLICSLAYSACGNVARSEDLAQETFITAWRQLGTLREREKLKSWLCGIARNRINNALRRETRDAVKQAEPIEAIAEAPSSVTTPADHVISQEEETLVWNALEQVPENYREPLVLFYREGRSVRKVADALELSEDAVKQRLSRGRQMLKEQVSALVETTLRDSMPKKAFAVAVLASLPALAPSAAAATVAASAKGSAAVKSVAALSWASAILGPVVGILGAYLGMKAGIENTRSPRERQFMVRMSWWAMALVLVFVVGLTGLMLFSRALARNHPLVFAAAIIGLVLFYIVALMALILVSNRRQRQIQLEEGTHWTQQPQATSAGTASAAQPPGFNYRSKAELLGLPLIHVCSAPTPGKPYGIPVAKGWIAIGGVARGVVLGIGGIACGAIAIGGVTAGLVSFSGLALGLLAIGGFACGVWAIGGFALGWMAVGGMAVAWHAAFGGLAVAHEIARGGFVMAQHANDEVARNFAEGAFVRSALFIGRQSQWLVVLAVAPVVIAWRQLRRKGLLGGAKRPA